MKQQKNNKKISFKGKDFFIGIDVHKKTWYISIRHKRAVVSRILCKNFINIF
ncbi:hypothetical protein JCM12298_01220 [Desulfothermus naphthae]